jgi:hypothetical protein
MSRLLLALFPVLSIAIGEAPPVAGSEPSKEAAQPTVISVLRAEIESRQPLDRRALLQSALEQSPDAETARWQAGYTRVAGEWRRSEKTDGAVHDALRHEYHTLRKAVGQSPDDHVRLANWCKARRLPEQERAHLTAALAFSGDRDLPHVRRRLGHVLANGRWMTGEEIAEAEQSSREMLEAMKVWGQRLQSIADRLAGNRRQRESAIADLRAIDDPAALPAIELVLTSAHEHAALQAVAWLEKVDRYESSLVLARQAAFSGWPSVRTAATQVLKSRRWEDFMPPLLAAMHRPVDSKSQILIGGRGEIFYTHLCAREMSDHWQLARYSITSFAARVSQRPGPFVARLNVGRIGRDLELTRSARRRNDTLRIAQDDFHARERLILDQNESTERFNTRIGTLLADVTGRSFTSSPNEWWNWLVARIDMEPRPRRVVIVDEQDRVILPPRDARAIQPSSCFVSGTPVWTDAGLVAIEAIQIGDRVLAKDVETGELAYKPVVLTTRREAPHVVRLTVGTESFEMTGGHLVWASGAGWTRARDLSAAQPLHTATGTASVDALESAEPATVYNIVVDEFHTYFFAESMILSHDTTIPRLTNVRVPGLPPEHLHPE